MAFPSVRSSVITSGTSASATPVINLPATVSAGDLLLVQFRSADAGAVGWPGGAGVWNELVDTTDGSTPDQVAIAWKKADGTEDGTTITLSSANAKFAATAWAIQDAADPTITPPAINTVVSALADPDSGSITPSGGSQEYLFGSLYSMAGEQGLTTYPTNYTLGQLFATSGTAGIAATNVTAGGAWRQLIASSEDPGAWDLTSVSDGCAYTVAIYPVAAVGTLENYHQFSSVSAGIMSVGGNG